LIFSSILWSFGRGWGEGGRKEREKGRGETSEKEEVEKERKDKQIRRFSSSLFSFLFFTHVSPRVVSLSPASSSVGTLGGGFLVPKMRRMVVVVFCKQENSS
jgi:hypothetical protein